MEQHAVMFSSFVGLCHSRVATLRAGMLKETGLRQTSEKAALANLAAPTWKALLSCLRRQPWLYFDAVAASFDPCCGQRPTV